MMGMVFYDCSVIGLCNGMVSGGFATFRLLAGRLLQAQALGQL